ncbi:MAG: hypothetical protein HYZ81_16100 [Nitrospinae bacterium]|nr:hypothetical protein [Nitrospinota bacterium]
MGQDGQRDWNAARLEAIRQGKATWAEHFAKKPLREASTTSGIQLDPLYTPADLPDFEYLRELGMPAILDATRAYATVGELTQVLREVFGEFHEPVTL